VIGIAPRAMSLRASPFASDRVLLAGPFASADTTSFFIELCHTYGNSSVIRIGSVSMFVMVVVWQFRRHHAGPNITARISTDGGNTRAEMIR
jgi:hypothetical protein